MLPDRGYHSVISDMWPMSTSCHERFATWMGYGYQEWLYVLTLYLLNTFLISSLQSGISISYCPVISLTRLSRTIDIGSSLLFYCHALHCLKMTRLRHTTLISNNATPVTGPFTWAFNKHPLMVGWLWQATTCCW